MQAAADITQFYQVASSEEVKAKPVGFSLDPKSSGRELVPYIKISWINMINRLTKTIWIRQEQYGTPS